MSAMTAPDDAWAMNSIAGLTLSATPSIASPWIATAIWNTPRVPKRDPIFAPSRMNAAMANVPAVIAVPTEVAGVSRSVVMPAIDTVSAFTANDAWICVSTTTISASHDVAAAGVTSPVVVAPLAPVEPVADVMHAPSRTPMHAHRTVSLYCGAPSQGTGREARSTGSLPKPGTTTSLSEWIPWRPRSSSSRWPSWRSCRNRVPLGIVAIGVSVALWITGILDLGQALAGFGDPTVIFIASLFVVSEALDATGVTAWAGRQVIGRAGTKRTPLLLVVCLLVAGVTALISVNGAVAALIPVVVVVATRAGLPPSQMLMPLAFSAHAGSLLALTGTPVNIIVSEAAADAGARPFGFFEFGLVGVPLVVGTLLVIAVLGRRLLPERAPTTLPQDVSEHARVLREQYALPEGTELIGVRRGVTEVVVAPRSDLIGLHLFPGMVTPSGDLVVLAVQRGGEDLVGTRRAAAGRRHPPAQGRLGRARSANTSGPDVLVVDDPSRVRAGRCRSARARSARSSSSRRWSCSSPRGSCPRRSPGSPRHPPWCSPAWSRRRRPTAASRGRRWCSWRA